MSVFSHVEFDNHEQVVFFTHIPSGLRAIVAIHNTNLGPSLGGCRMWPYASDSQALTDVLRLSRGMTYKSAIAGLPLGVGKCVIIGDPRKDKSTELLHALGSYIEGLSGAYITAEDSGTSVADMVTIRERTQYAAGVVEGSEHGGDPSPSTAYGTFVGLQAAVKYHLQRSNLQGVKVAIQGVGNVGYHLARHLTEAGAKLVIADIHAAHTDRVTSEFGAQVVSAEAIYAAEVDVFAPCAMGSSINEETIDLLKAKVIAGAANNQLSRPDLEKQLAQREILYAPDYVINAGGIIDIAYQRSGESSAALKRHIEMIGLTLTTIFENAAENALPTGVVADQIAEQRFKSADHHADGDVFEPQGVLSNYN